MSTLASILLVILIGFVVWNLNSLKALIRLTKNGENQPADARYFELKYNIQFLLASSTVLITTVGILGYNSFEGVKKELLAGAKKSVDSITIRMNLISSQLKHKRDSTLELNNKIIRMAEQAKELEVAFNQIKSLETKIKVINAKNILKQNYYIVPSIEYIPNDKGKKIFFKDLVTNIGDKLPEFKLPPLVSNSRFTCINTDI